MWTLGTRPRWRSPARTTRLTRTSLLEVFGDEPGGFQADERRQFFDVCFGDAFDRAEIS